MEGSFLRPKEEMGKEVAIEQPADLWQHLLVSLETDFCPITGLPVEFWHVSSVSD